MTVYVVVDGTPKLLLDRGPQPRNEIVQVAKESLSLDVQPFLELAPSLPEVWVGREELLSIITYDWLDEETFVTGLVGFAGEGKSSIARKWVERLLSTEQSTDERCNGIFWWSFYNNNSTVDLFFENALNYLSNHQLDLAPFPTAHSRAELLAAALKSKRYLFILDGLERLQYLGGEDYGLLKSNDLARFLEYFAAGEHRSYCLITSRARITNLVPYRTYTQFDINRLSNQDGCTLLSELGVQAKSDTLKQMVEYWAGHALTLTLLASHMVRLHDPGDLGHAGNHPPVKQYDDKFQLVYRVMLPYDSHLSQEERRFMQIFCLFRLPVSKSALKSVFQTDASIANQLMDYYLLRFDSEQSCYTTHPLMKEFYVNPSGGLSNENAYDTQELHLHAHQTSLKLEPQDVRHLHHRIADYYLTSVEDIPKNPSINDLSYMVEAVHHLCLAEDFGRANEIRLESNSKGLSLTKEINRLGAYDTEFLLLQDFFPNKEINCDPLVETLKDKLSILFETGESLTNLGRMAEALPTFERFKDLASESNSQENIIKGFLSLAKFYVYLGKLSKAKKYADKALDLSRKVSDIFQEQERAALIYLALVMYLRGQMKESGFYFDEAESLLSHEYEYDGKRFFYGTQGVIYVDYLLSLVDESNKSNILKQAKFIIDANFDRHKHQKQDDLSRFYRTQGDLNTIEGDIENANANYAEAVRIARRITHWPALTGMLSARGQWMARVYEDIEVARNDLEEALEYAITGGYRLYEADIYIGFAWASHVDGNVPNARNNAKQAMALSEKIGYSLGLRKANEVMEAIDDKIVHHRTVG